MVGMYKVAVIGDFDTVMGFKLAGVGETYEVENSQDAGKVLRQLSKRDDIGVIIMTERVAEGVTEVLEEVLKTRKARIPVIVEVPDKRGPMKRLAVSIREMVKRAIGIEVTLR
jgi:V/A-type H+-transporting ATPase subunit F